MSQAEQTVYTRGGTPVYAAPLTDANGNPILGPSGQPILAPAGFDLDTFAQNVGGNVLNYYYFETGGEYDLQRSDMGAPYSFGGPSESFVSAFTPLASYALGYAAGYNGIPLTEVELGGGLNNLNQRRNNSNINTSGYLRNNPTNVANIAAGYSAGESSRNDASGTTPGSGNGSDTTPGSGGNTPSEPGNPSSTPASGGGSGTIAEVDLATDAELSVYTPPAGFAYSPAALLLPDIDGFGLMPDLRVAMSLDPTLLAEVQSLVTNAGTMDWSDFNAAFEAMVSDSGTVIASRRRSDPGAVRRPAATRMSRAA